MGWLKRVRAGLAAAEKASELAQEVQSLRAEVEEGTDLVASVRADVATLERDADQLRIDWATTLDKIGRWASRQSARERKDTNTKLDKLGEGPEPNGAAPDPGTLTKPQLRALAARQRMGGASVASDASE